MPLLFRLDSLAALVFITGFSGIWLAFASLLEISREKAHLRHMTDYSHISRCIVNMSPSAFKHSPSKQQL